MQGSSKRRVWVRLTLCAVSLATGLLVVELAFRLAGYRPYVPMDPSIRVEPAGKYQAADPLLGYRHLPGVLRVTFPTGDQWTTTHLENTLRITRPLESYAEDSGRDEVWLFGCSYVHGWGLNDEDTIAWRLQERVPQLEIVNFGVGGYGNWQSLLQYREAVSERGPPRIAILVYASFHDERNTRSRRWRRATFEYNQFGTTAQPYVRAENDQLVPHFDHAGYQDFFLLRWSALANYLDGAYSRREVERLASHRVSRMIIDELADACRSDGALFLLAGITADELTMSCLTDAGSRGIDAMGIPVDTRDPRNVLYDGHPSAHATQQYAQMLEGGIRALLAREDYESQRHKDPGAER